MSPRPGGGTRAQRTARPTVIKEPVWKPEIPFYLYAGGMAGASAGVAVLAGDSVLGRRAWLAAMGGAGVSPVLLISDLGVPSRFLNMLRLFKVTSPMSVGSWILAGFGTATAGGALHAWSGGRLGAPGRAAQVTSAVLGLPLATYTAALITNTAVPAWHEARQLMPFVFGAGAAQSAGAAVAMLAPAAEAGPARRLAVGGAVAELALTTTMKQSLGDLGAAYHEGRAAKLSHASTALTAGGAALMALRGRRSRAAAIGAGAMLTAGAMCERWSIFLAGKQSARRPQDTIGPQRARLNGR